MTTQAQPHHTCTFLPDVILHDPLRNFSEWDSKRPGHAPSFQVDSDGFEFRYTPFVPDPAHPSLGPVVESAGIPGWLLYFDGTWDRWFREHDNQSVERHTFSSGEQRLIKDHRTDEQIVDDESAYHAARRSTRAKSPLRSGARYAEPRSPHADNAFEYVIQPLDEHSEGWFPLGEVSLIGGSSGAGKTTWALDILEKQAAGETVLEHKTLRRSYLALLADRGTNALQRTARRMNLDLATLPHAVLKPGTGTVERIEAEYLAHGKPEVLFVEGVDMLAGDASNPETVAAFLNQLLEFAHHYHVAVIGSIGSPKMKARDGYVSTRDKIIGSQIWGRMVETIVYISRENGKESDDLTDLEILPRQAKVETYKMRFSRGRLTVVPEGLIESNLVAESDKDLIEWVRNQECFTRAQCARRFPKINGGRLTRRLEGFVTSGFVKASRRGGKTTFIVPCNAVNTKDNHADQK